MQQILESAIANKKLVQFQYSGHPRIAEPHVLGISGSAVQFLGYQIGGSSSSGGIPEWRRFDLNKISALQATDESFPGKRPFPSGKHSQWDRVIAIVS